MCKRHRIIFVSIDDTACWYHNYYLDLEEVYIQRLTLFLRFRGGVYSTPDPFFGIALFRKLMIALKEGNIDKIKAEIEAYIAYFRLYLDRYLRWMKFYVFEPTISRN